MKSFLNTNKITDLIPISDRGHMFILEQCRIEKEGHVVVYKQTEGGYVKIFNIPDINTNLLILGNGTSITNEALFFLASNNVTVMFSKGHGHPVFADIDLISITATSEYRPVEYNQNYAKIFFNETKRLETARLFMKKRVENTKKYYGILVDEKIIPFIPEYNSISEFFLKRINTAKNVQEILMFEAEYVKEIYKMFTVNYNTDFTRNHNDTKGINGILTQLNYLCYSIANVVLYTLGINHTFSVLHGKTRRGALVFDVADLIKDGLSVPFAFYFYHKGIKNDTAFKYEFIDFVYENNVMHDLFAFVKNVN
ncbi:MAG: type I-F CRISPR-associated endonuclease Cas1 [Chlorobi bacterium]|nr:type I-F CRISPR-associated endonuclease Cas1 [Chlorobiota bacterium]